MRISHEEPSFSLVLHLPSFPENPTELQWEWGILDVAEQNPIKGTLLACYRIGAKIEDSLDSLEDNCRLRLTAAI